MDDPAPSRGPELVAGSGEPPRHRFEERREAAAAIGFTGVGLHVDDLPRTEVAGLEVAGMRTVLDGMGLRLGEIEFRTDRPADRGLLDAARG